MSNGDGGYVLGNALILTGTGTASETSAPSIRIDAATFGRAIARAVKEHPYSSNWALVGMAIELVTGEEVSDIEEVPELIDRLAAESEVTS